MKTFAISVISKTVAFLSHFFGLGAGVTWPGEIGLAIDRNLIKNLVKDIGKGVILVAGTNGKTTTALMINHILTLSGYKVIHNRTGANLLNGIAGTLLLKTDFFGRLKADYAIFEVDEATFPLISKEVKPLTIVLLNLFRDQLDRYGEVDMIALMWKKSLTENVQSSLIANADDPLIAYIAKGYKNKVLYFGLDSDDFKTDKLSHATDSIYCLNCGDKLEYKRIYLSHLGEWNCVSCKNHRPNLDLTKVNSPLTGVYNIYNSLAAILASRTVGIEMKTADQLLKSFKPAFGRQEIFESDGKKIQIFLSKNPAGFNESTRTVLEQKDINTVMFILNDRIPDGRDVSWIWDVDITDICQRAQKIIVSGDRVWDMGLRVKYTSNEEIQNSKFKIQNLKSKAKSKLIIKERLDDALTKGLESIKGGETLYIFPTYSAMLEVRKIITGRKI